MFYVLPTTQVTISKEVEDSTKFKKKLKTKLKLSKQSRDDSLQKTQP